jgi:hypothetical protein
LIGLKVRSIVDRVLLMKFTFSLYKDDISAKSL